MARQKEMHTLNNRSSFFDNDEIQHSIDTTYSAIYIFTLKQPKNNTVIYHNIIRTIHP